MPALRYDPALARAGSSFFWSPRLPTAAPATGVVRAEHAIAASDRHICVLSVLETRRRTDSWCGPNQNNPPLVDCFSCL
jgi:hypothetical protein